MMRSVLNEGTGAGARSAGFTPDAAGKSGTTNDLRDAWFVGFTPELLTVVWVGLDDNQPLGFSGIDGGAPHLDDLHDARARRPREPDVPGAGRHRVRRHRSRHGARSPARPARASSPKRSSRAPNRRKSAACTATDRLRAAGPRALEDSWQEHQRYNRGLLAHRIRARSSSSLLRSLSERGLQQVRNAGWHVRRPRRRRRQAHGDRQAAPRRRRRRRRSRQQLPDVLARVNSENGAEDGLRAARAQHRAEQRARFPPSAATRSCARSSTSS